MDRTRRVIEIWNWLPAFRVVAETEHLPTAAKELKVAASALSRSVRLIEEVIGQPMFQRAGRRLELNEAGKAFLSLVRNAMRLVDDGLDALKATQHSGAFCIHAPGPLCWTYILPIIDEICAHFPSIVPSVQQFPFPQVNESLCKGDLDFVLLHSPTPHADLVLERIDGLSYGVYCGKKHPLAAKKKLTLEELQPHPFITHVDPQTDPWPPDIQRTIRFKVDDFCEIVRRCATGAFLAVMPNGIEKVTREGARLHRLPLSLGLTLDVFAVYRRPQSPSSKSLVFLSRIRKGRR